MPSIVSSSLPLPEKHKAFERWALDHGITFSKIKPAAFPNGAGAGIISTEPITGPEQFKQRGAEHRLGFSVGEQIAFCPTSALVTRESAREFLPKQLPTMTSHASIAAALAREARNKDNRWWPWLDILPTFKDFKTIMPLLWEEKQRELLPPSAISLLKLQEEKFKKDWSIVSGAGLVSSKDDYTWAWLTVNTRSLFYKLDTPEYDDLPREECMALCPFIDYFNHSDEGVSDSENEIENDLGDQAWLTGMSTAQCKVELTPQGYMVTTNSVIDAPGTQLFVSYGCHSNDFLLVEYGFILNGNKWDEVSIDPLIMPDLGDSRKQYLGEEGFLGNYIFDKSTFCYRTQAAVRMLLIPMGTYSESRMVNRWRQWLAGQEEGEREQAAVDGRLLRILDELRDIGNRSLAEIEKLEHGPIKDMLERRWEQVLEMADSVEKETRKVDDGVPMRRFMI